MNYRKKLIEVALPLEAINVASARENYIYRGNPSAVHKWWAQRPLAACRAVIFASLVDDPDSDPAYAHYDAETREHMAGAKRQQLFDLITELVQWENSNNELVINAARAEIARCVASRKIELGELKKDQKLPGGETVYDLVVKGHGDLAKLREGKARLPKIESVNAFLIEHAPPLLDPFCGGGSIPLEAQRLGLRAYASDLNPVPVLITKSLIEIPPAFSNNPPVNPQSRGEAGPAGKKGKGKGKSVTGRSEWRGAQGLAEDVRYYGKRMRDEAERLVGHHYPQIRVTGEMANGRPDLKPYVGVEFKIISWLWARTVRSPNPAMEHRRVPLLRSLTLSTRRGRYVRLQVPSHAATTSNWSFNILVTDASPPSAELKGTVSRKGARCIVTNDPIKLDYVREEGVNGQLGMQLLAAVIDTPTGRLYIPAQADQVVAGSLPGPETSSTPLPKQALGFRVQRYGLDTHQKLFTGRQLHLMECLTTCLALVKQQVLSDAENAGVTDAEPYAKAVLTYLAFAIDKHAMYGCSLVPWYTKEDRPSMLFGRQALSMVWDFVEVNPFASIGGSIEKCIEIVGGSITDLGYHPIGQVEQASATSINRPPHSTIVSTDPPYYDNVPYADLSDFFYVWLRRFIGSEYPSLFGTVLTPKNEELVADPYRYGGAQAAELHFLEGMKKVFKRVAQYASVEVPVTIYYAFKQTEDAEDEIDSEDGESNEATRSSTGWETFLQAAIEAGLTVGATWPMRTERKGRLRDTASNALASSIVLSCRIRSANAPHVSRREFVNALKRELLDALKHLQRGNIAPVDLAQSAIGPGMAIFSRYGKVVEADGSQMMVWQALAMINQTLDEVLAEQEGEFDGDTRWAVAWFEQFGMEEGAFGMAETLSKAKNTAVNGLVDAGIIAARAGKVRLLKRGELPEDWNPATDNKVRHWEVAQHLIRALETGGETAAADLLRKVGGMGEVARDLAYRLYNLCERKKWASEALSYNGLVIAWPEITKLAQQAVAPKREVQGEMF